MAHNIPPIKLLGEYIPSIPLVVDAPALAKSLGLRLESTFQVLVSISRPTGSILVLVTVSNQKLEDLRSRPDSMALGF